MQSDDCFFCEMTLREIQALIREANQVRDSIVEPGKQWHLEQKAHKLEQKALRMIMTEKPQPERRRG